MANYTSQFSGQHNDNYDERITSLLNTINEQSQTIVSLTNQITTLQSSLNNMQNNLQTQINNLMPISGNNSNGSYCKFPDGTLIQWGQKNITSGTYGSYGSLYIYTATIDFPISFNAVETPKIFGAGKFGTGASMAAGDEGCDVATGYLRVFDVTSRSMTTSSPLRIRWMAIGKWK